jgi:hypothetical protein
MKYKTEELARYLYNYRSDLLTKAERTAYKNTLVLKKIENSDSPKMKDMLRRKWYSSDEEVLELLRDGEAAFFKKLEKRVLRDNPAKTFMNLCLKCGYLAKTSKAKQCWKCFYSWHEEVENES